MSSLALAQRPQETLTPLDRLELLCDPGSLQVIRSQVTSRRMGAKTRPGDGVVGGSGLVEGRPGQGTFVLRTLGPPSGDHVAIRRALERWMRSALAAGLEADDLIALFETSLRGSQDEEVVA